MPDPLFDSRTPRLEMPLLFAGQSQKEGFVNEAVTRIDALLHGAIEGEAATPPASPTDGQCWLIGAGPTGEWAGQAGKIAARQAGNWLFFAPRDGMKLLNRATGQEIRYNAAWQIATRPAAPSGGTTIDAEARSAVAAILTSLTTAGIIPPA
jgi:Protein of unknown function (DUF2793)